MSEPGQAGAVGEGHLGLVGDRGAEALAVQAKECCQVRPSARKRFTEATTVGLAWRRHDRADRVRRPASSWAARTHKSGPPDWGDRLSTALTAIRRAGEDEDPYGRVDDSGCGSHWNGNSAHTACRQSSAHQRSSLCWVQVTREQLWLPGTNGPASSAAEGGERELPDGRPQSCWPRVAGDRAADFLDA